MQTVTLPKNKYQALEKKAELYERLLQREEGVFPIEMYTQQRLKEFLREDRIDAKLRKKMQKLLRS